jgi:sugar/nucleoside kinase (ribokinase family)
VIGVALGCVEAVKARGGTVSFDPNLRPELLGSPGLREALEAILGRCDIFLPSGGELFLFTRARDEAGAVAELFARGVPEIAWKRGAEGQCGTGRRGRSCRRASRWRRWTPTGAGDCFGAAYVCLRLRGAQPAEALRVACACGALAVTRKGPMEGTPTLARRSASWRSAGREGLGRRARRRQDNVKLSAVTPEGAVAETLAVANEVRPGARRGGTTT